MTQHSGPTGPEDDDHGPPDWFAAVAEPESESAPEPGPGSGRRRRSAPAVAPERARSARRSAARPADAEEFGLVSASELPAGRRRRRSALAAEQPTGRTAGEGDGYGGAGAAGHGGAAAPAPAYPAFPRSAEERPGRRSGRTRRSAAREDADHDGGYGADAADGTGGPERSGGASRRGRAEEPADPESRARDICLRLLTGAAKTRKQLADALRKREIPDEVAEEVLTRLEEVGLIDDAAFARAWVESRHSVRGLSRRALAQELRTKGVAGDLAEQALAQVDPDDETEAARALVERRLRTTRGLERQTRTRRLVGMLARRGYSEGLAFRVVREALDEEEAGAGEPAAAYGDTADED
ncbi:recombination regulator RecX [Kitasatospora sp. NPDC057692]|uniref:recombination regulator RecX n=1 Tax=Kitasatospora sp. NPDC057692 TaxID=3346215 RepID=UPI00367F10F0